MKIITAIEEYEKRPDEISCFLGGGITNCPEWQNEVIKILSTHSELDKLVIYNPRRPNFPINDPNASQDQIEWEFKYLTKADIFTMFFCNTPKSDQPICFYELGRYVTNMINNYPDDYQNRIVVTCESGFRRENDVIYQLRCLSDKINLTLNSNPQIHAENIIKLYDLMASNNSSPLF